MKGGVKLKTNVIYNEDCLVTMQNHIEENSIDLILTSPPYNISVHCFDYDEYEDKKNFSEYSDFILKCFAGFDRILKKNGVLIWNQSFGNSNISDFFVLLGKIIQQTNFEIVDRFVWKKKCAMPDNLSSNKTTRIVEDIFIFKRKNETIRMNKKITSVRSSGQKMYAPIYNFIEAKNNDFANNLNKATFSSELVLKLLNIYCCENYIIYDPFMGTGTTAIGVKKFENGCVYIGSEISKKQVEYSQKRIATNNNKFIGNDCKMPLF